METHFAGTDAWRWNGSSAEMSRDKSETGRGRVGTDIKSVGTGGDRCIVCRTEGP